MLMRKILLLFNLLFLASIGNLFAQGTVTGTIVSEEDRSPIPGVSVQVEGSNRGTISDIEGNYTINVDGPDDVLVFSFIGYQTIRETAGTRSNISVTLLEDVQQLSEVVVVGYGTQLKEDLTGNIARVQSKDIENIPTPSIEGAMQGRAAGVFIESSSGKVGQGMKMRVRGAASITGDNQPLYVVDGIIVNSQDQSGISSAINPIADINFNDVESIDILKDASAAAIYGSRGANGVVIITTKKGTRGETKYNFGALVGASRETRRREFLNADEYIMMLRESATNTDIRFDQEPGSPGSELDFADFLLDRFSAHTNLGEHDSDWQDEAFRDRAGFQQYDFSASGGNEKTRFFISGQYTDQEGILIGNAFERISARMNLEHQASERVSFGVNMAMSRTQNVRVDADNQFSNPMQLVAQPSVTPIRDPDGNLYDRPITPYYNGLVEDQFADFVSTNYRFLGKTFAEFKLTDKLSFRSDYGFDFYILNEDRFQGSQTLAGNSADNTGVGYSRWNQVVNYNWSNYFNYITDFGEDHLLDVTLGMEYQNGRRDITRVEGQGIPVDDLRKLASASEITFGSSILDQYRFTSYFTRVNYKLMNRFLFSLSGRYDGSSRFGVDNRFGFFPAGSVGWVMSDENFFDNIKNTVSFFKPRVSYGIVGNAEIGNFQHLALWEAGAYANRGGLRPLQVANPLLGWETTSQLDVGIDFGFFNNRITGEIDYYNKTTTDLLLNVPLPFTTGFTSITDNLGSVENRGVELVLNTTNIQRNNFSWNTSFNIAFNRNRVLDIGDQDIIDDGGGTFMNVVQVGQPIGAFYGAEYAGADPANGDALWFVNGDEPGATTNVFNDANFVILGDPNPDYFGGLNNTFTFGNFDAAIFLQWVGGYQIHRSGDRFMSGNMDWVDNQTRDQLARWQNPGDITDVPQARFGLQNGQQSRSSRYLSDGDYLRLKTVTFGYSLPTQVLERAGVRSARFYVTGQNLLTFTDYIGWDPEVSTDYLANRNLYQSIDFYSAPQARTFIVGVNVGF